MNIVQNINVPEQGWCDAKLLGHSFANDGRDLVLSWVLGNGKSADLKCTWAHMIKIELQSALREGGPPLTWDATFKQVDKNEWLVKFDFASKGMIELMCSEIILDYD